jgi:threonine dehydrogenase-like Zn-dependent dehydrogenase
VTGHVSPTDQDIALVYGAGPMGLTTIQVLKRVYRVKQVIVVDRIDERLQMAQRNGADWVINNSDEPLAETLKAKGILPTLIIDAACHPYSTGGGHPGLPGGENCIDGILHGTFPGCAAGDYRQRAFYFLLAS